MIAVRERLISVSLTLYHTFPTFNPETDDKILDLSKTKTKAFADLRHRPFKSFRKQANVFTCLQYKSYDNTVGKGETARNEQILLFYCLGEFSAIFTKFEIVVCKLFQFGRV